MAERIVIQQYEPGEVSESALPSQRLDGELVYGDLVRMQPPTVLVYSRVSGKLELVPVIRARVDSPRVVARMLAGLHGLAYDGRMLPREHGAFNLDALKANDPALYQRAVTILAEAGCDVSVL